MKKEGNAHNLQLSVDRRSINHSIAAGAVTEHLASMNDMREARKVERYLTNNENRLSMRLLEHGEQNESVNEPVAHCPSEEFVPGAFTAEDDIVEAVRQFRRRGR